MDAQIITLLAAFDRLRQTEPANLESAIRLLPEPEALPSSWETWTLIGLVRHRIRQLWVADVIRTRLRGSLSDLARLGALGIPEGVPQSGPVPGMPEWEYFFHGCGCCLTHKVDGAEIDVDFWGDSAEYFDTFFYTRYLQSLRNPEPPEQRLLELYHSTRAIRIAVDDLIAAGALTSLADRGRHPPRVADAVLEHAEAIETFWRAWVDPANRLWLGALCGDWLAAHEAAGGRPEIAELTRLRADKCRHLRRDRLLQLTGFAAADALHALAELGTADEQVEKALRGPPTGLVSAALDIVEEQDAPRWCPLIYSLYCRVNAKGNAPESQIWMRSLKFLLKHGYQKDEMLGALPRAGGTEIGEAILLALEHAPQHALRLIRKALHSHTPINRTEVAAILAVIGKPWSIGELLAALEASDDQERTADIRAALLETGDEKIQNLVLAWEERNPHENEAGSYLEIGGKRIGPFYTIKEISLKNRAVYMRYEMDRLHDRAIKVKDVVPPEPAKSSEWWRFWMG
jgi:hypothetical protein